MWLRYIQVLPHLRHNGQASVASRFLSRGASLRTCPCKQQATAHSRFYSADSQPHLAPGSIALEKSLAEVARQQPTGVPLAELVDPTNVQPEEMLKNAKFLWKDLPIRFARRARELENLPYGLSTLAPIRTVRSWYAESFKDLLSIREPQDMDSELEFTNLLEQLCERHKNVVMMATGIMMLREQMSDSISDCPFLQDFLDRFYMSRIGIKTLMEQHIALHHPAEGYIGIVNTALDAKQIADAAVGDATMLCESEYGIAPEVNIIGADNQTFSYVPGHLHYMLLELLKNSMRATCEHHAGADELPDIDIVVSYGEGDVCIKVGDSGGGIPRRDASRVWTYLYTTAKLPDLSSLSTGWTATSILAGLGYGLPVCRLYARYFGGDLEIISMEKYGTDAYLYLNKIGDSPEFLPV